MADVIGERAMSRRVAADQTSGIRSAAQERGFRRPFVVPAAAWMLWASVLPCLAQESAGGGRLEIINGYKVLEVSGSPREMGEQHGRLLRDEVRRMIKDLILDGECAYGDSHERLLRGARAMERFQPVEFRLELRALARAADVNYEDLLAAQLFGDVWRAMWCTSYAVFGAATATGECIVGRNMDYWDHGVTKYGAILLYARPDRGYPFVTVTWAGIINGWTLMNARGIVVANNTAYGGRKDSLHGISTCFMLRKVAQYAATVQEGVQIIQNTPRACGTNMLVAGGRPPAACIVEYDHLEALPRWAEQGVVFAANDFRKLYREEQSDEDDAADYGSSYSYYSRYELLAKLIRENYGKTDRSMNFAAEPGVAITSINLHSALLFPGDLSFAVAMGKTPACRQPYRRFRMTGSGIVSAE